MLKISIILAVMVCFVAAVLWWRLKGEVAPPKALVAELNDFDDELFSMDPADEGFVLEADGPASFSQERIGLRGRLQTYVRS